MNYLLSLKRSSTVFKWLGLLLLLLYIIREAFGGGDLDYYRYVAERLSNYENIYIPKNDLNFSYTYGIIFTTILIPLNYINPIVVNFLWLVLQVFALYRISIIIGSFLPLDKLKKKQINLIILFCFLLTLRFIQNNFGVLQSNIFILYFSLEGLFQIKMKNRNILGGSLLAFAATIKFLPLLLLPLLIYRKRIKASIVFVAAFLFFFILVPIVFLGFEYTVTLLETWLDQIALTLNSFSIDKKEIDKSAHDLNAWLLTLLTKTDGEFSFSRNILNLDYSQAKFIIGIFRGILVVLTLFILRSIPFSKERSKIDFFREIAYILLVTPLLFPMQQKYAFVHTLPAIVYLLWYLFNFRDNIKDKQQRKWIKIILIFSFICFTMSADFFIGRYLCNITHYYKTITYGTLVLIPALFIAKPKLYYPKK